MHCLPHVILALALCALLSPPEAFAERRSSNYRLGLRSAGRGEHVVPEGRFTSSIVNKLNTLKGSTSTTTAEPSVIITLPTTGSTTSPTSPTSPTSATTSPTASVSPTPTATQRAFGEDAGELVDEEDSDALLGNARAYNDDLDDDEEDDSSAADEDSAVDSDVDDDEDGDFYMLAAGSTANVAAEGKPAPVAAVASGDGYLPRPSEQQWRQYQLEQRNRRRMNRLQREHNQRIRELVRRQRISQRRNSQRIQRIQKQNRRRLVQRNRRNKNKSQTQRQRRRRNNLERRRRQKAQRQRRRQRLNQRRLLRQLLRRRRGRGRSLRRVQA